jgi:hypothetical protein
MSIFLVAAAALQAAAPPAVPPPGAAANWVEIGSTEQRRAWIDAGGLRRDGDLVRVSGRIRFAAVDETGAQRLTYENEIDCAARTWRVLNFTATAPDGSVVTRADDLYEQLEPIRPGTNAAEIYTLVCPAAAATTPS